MTDLLGSDTKPFFDRWRVELVESMTLIELLPEGRLYYCMSPFSCNVWVFVGPDSVIVSYCYFEALETIREKVLQWARGLAIAPGLDDSRTGGTPVYGAKEHPRTQAITVVWFSPGDWFGLTRRHPLPRQWHQLPLHWPESYRGRIAELAGNR